MDITENVPVESKLKGSAAKVLLHLLAHRGETLSNAEIMRGSGVHDRNTFFAAKRQLQDFELWENPDWFFQTVGVIPHTVGGNTQTVGVIPHTPALPESPTTLIVASPARALEPLEEPRDFQREAMQADLMDGSGDRNHLNSPYAARRAEQIRVLSDAFAEMFNRPLTPVAAKRWLVLTEDSAEAVLEVIEYTHAHKGSQMESPFGYIEAVLKNKRDEARKAALQGGPGGQAAPAADNYWLSEPTERTKRVREKLLAAGLLKPEEDD